MAVSHKSITVHFFSIDTDDETINKLVSAFNSLIKLKEGTDIFTHSQCRYLIKWIENKSSDNSLLFWAAIKERNTWQIRTKNDGSLNTLHDANSIIGDASFFKFDSKKKILAAFTTYSSTGYLKAMCNTIFRRLLPRSSNYSVDYLTDDKMISQITDWDYFSKLSIKLDTKNISEYEEKPDLINSLLSIKDAFGSSLISITLDCGKEMLPKQDVTETINYLSSSESCESLSLSGGMFGENEKKLSINLSKAFIQYHKNFSLRANQKIININDADIILNEAFENTEIPSMKE